MVTQFVILPLWEGQTFHDPSGRTCTLFKGILNTLTKQHGFQRAYCGTQHENPNMLQLAVDWDTINDCVQFTASNDYEIFFDNMREVVDTSKTTLYHANLFPHPPLQAISMPNSPVTETVLIYFEKDYPQTDQDNFDSDIRQLAVTIQNHSPEVYTGFAGGWVVEDLPFPDSGSRKEGKAYVGFSGWRSIEDHLNFTDTQVFKDNFQLLRGAKDWQGLTVCHVTSRRIDKDAGD